MTTTYNKNKKKAASSTVTFDSSGIVAGDTIKVTGSSYTSNDGTYIVSNTSSNTITLGDLPYVTEERFADLEDSVEAIKRRLAILDEPDPEKLKKHKMLEEAYKKYKMIEALIGEKRDD